MKPEWERCADAIAAINVASTHVTWAMKAAQSLSGHATEQMAAEMRDALGGARNSA